METRGLVKHLLYLASRSCEEELYSFRKIESFFRCDTTTIFRIVEFRSLKVVLKLFAPRLCSLRRKKSQRHSAGAKVKQSY